MKHFHETGSKYPLVVKLGTITPQGADVYSYAPDEDDLVLDPLLKEHLAHWGINMASMEKTAKTMSELQVHASFATFRLLMLCKASRPVLVALPLLRHNLQNVLT